MSFDTSAYLRVATSRAKSDVANKLISMFLHEVSRRAAEDIGLTVRDNAYTRAVASAFGNNCAYCGCALEKDRAAVEHLEGMNRLRAGLHIPGNVVVSCRRCNGEKRRDDSLQTLVLAETGWESFLSHDGSRCPQGCNSCAYWTAIWAKSAERQASLRNAREKILQFRALYPKSTEWTQKAKPQIVARLDALYRECQEFATVRIKEAVDQVFASIAKPKN